MCWIAWVAPLVQLPDDTYQDGPHDQYAQAEKDHGRIATRRSTLIIEPAYLAYLDPKQPWRGLAAIVLVEVERQTGTETTTERRYSLTSHTDAARFVDAVHSHWGIENRLHGVLDVVFMEDHIHIALNMVRQEPSKGSMRVKRTRAGWDNDDLRTVLGL